MSVAHRQRRVVVKTNAFALSWDNTGEIYYYDVIRPNWSAKPGAEANRPPIGQAKGYELVSRLQREIAPKVFVRLGAFDGKHNLYSFLPYNLGGPSASWQVPWDNSGSNTRTVTITITFTRTANLKVVSGLHGQHLHDACNILTLAVQAEPRSKEGIFNSKSFFTNINRQTIRNAAPLEFWRGFYQSVRPVSSGLIVNVDVTAGVVLPERDLKDVCCEYMKLHNARELDNLDRRSMARLKLFLQGVKITIKIHVSSKRRPKTVKDIVPDVGNRTFTTKEGESLTVADHFKRVYNLPIPRGTLGIKTSDGNLFPITACKTIQQLFKKTTSPEIVSEALKFAPKDPALRLQAITSGWSSLAHGNSEILHGARISIDSSPLRVEGEVLQPPIIGFRQEKPEVTYNLDRDPGSWNLKGKPLLVPARINRWTIIDWTMNSQSSDMSFFIDGLIRNMMDRGIRFSENWKNDLTVKRSNAARAREDLEDAARSSPDIIVAILPDKSPEIYRDVKRFGDVLKGITTQCVKWTSKRADDARQHRNMDQYHNNLILKINAKLGGINWFPISDALNYLKSKPTMVIGADVSHPGPGSHFPSVASLVGSFDGMMSKYAAVTRPQEARLEMIGEIQAMFKSLLMNFSRQNGGVYPARVLVYRDGVSEGEFETVKGMELAEMGKAVEDVYGSDQRKWPEVTLIVVGKRHHIRFFPEKPGDMHRNGNLPPGFTVIKGIDHLRYNDFYLQSQAGLLGTSRPSHYTVLVNRLTYTLPGSSEAQPLSTERLQQISYALCHCYARSSSSVKVPAPVYYADLVCRRAKIHLDEQAAGGLDDELVSIQSGSDAARTLEYFKEHWSPINVNMRDKMYFV